MDTDTPRPKGHTIARPLGLLSAVSLLLASASLNAHHSAAAYDNNATKSVTGVVDRLQWRNPHVIIRLEVEEAGKKTYWAPETTSIPKLVADGWNKALLAPGETITAEIRPTKKGDPAGILRWVTLADGRVLPIDKESPAGKPLQAANKDPVAATSLSRKATATRADYLARRSAVEKIEASNRPSPLPKTEEGGKTGALDPSNLEKHKGVALFDFTGVWQHRANRELAEKRGGFPWDFLPVPELTAKSKAIHKDVMARRAAGDATADPATLCYPHGLVRSMTRAGNMMLLQENTALFMVHRMNNDFRAIYWDGRQHVDPAIRVDSYNGDSIAYWADDHLFVETVGFGQPFTYINSGIPIGKQGRIEERWRLVNDGNTLEIEFRMTDPEHWVGEWVDTKFWDRIYGADIAEANCIMAEDAELAIGAK